MKPKRNRGGLIYLILFSFLLECHAQAQNGLCSLDTNSGVQNICDRSNYLVYVSESGSGCRAPGTKCWCILVDNRNRAYDGDMVIELVQMFNTDNSFPGETQFGDVKSYLSYKIIAGINRVLVQPYTPPEAFTKITSIKIRNNEICFFANTTPQLQITYQRQPTYTNTPSLPSTDYSSEEYRYFSDCMLRNNYTTTSVKLCPQYTPEIMIEKRYALNNELYWCINIINENYLFNSANRLHIVYSSPNRRFVFSPLDAYIDQSSNPGSNFHLGNRRTTIAISQHNNQLADLTSVTIDNHPICSYFRPRIIPTQPPPTKQFYSVDPPTETRISVPDEPEVQPLQPAELFIPADESIKNSNPDLVEYPESSKPETPQQTTVSPGNTPKRCGVKPINKNSLISFGLSTSPGDWPWHAALYKLQSRSTNRLFICGGTLIDRKTIVTAAHCVLEFNLVVIPERLTVELGRHDLNHASVATQEYRVFDIRQHEAYNPDSYENDIAIVILANYVQLTQYVHFICLPSTNVNLQNQVGTTVGWGRDHNNQIQTELKGATLPVVDKIMCLTSNREFFGQFLTNTNFCAGYMNKTSVCRGDSGGGLVFKNKHQWFLGGITSLGVLSKSDDNECDLRQYVIFTDVTKYISWIKRYS